MVLFFELSLSNISDLTEDIGIALALRAAILKWRLCAAVLLLHVMHGAHSPDDCPWKLGALQ